MKITEKDLTEEQLKVYNELNDSLKAEYLAKLNEEPPAQNNNPTPPQNGDADVDIIEQMQQTAAKEVEEKEVKKKNASNHQKRVVKKKQEQKPKEEEKSTFRKLLPWGLAALGVIALFKVSSSTKGQDEHNPAPTGKTTEENHSTNNSNITEPVQSPAVHTAGGGIEIG